MEVEKALLQLEYNTWDVERIFAILKMGVLITFAHWHEVLTILDRKIPVLAWMEKDKKPSRHSKPHRWMNGVQVMASRVLLLERARLSNRVAAMAQENLRDMFPGPALARNSQNAGQPYSRK